MATSLWAAIVRARDTRVASRAALKDSGAKFDAHKRRAARKSKDSVKCPVTGCYAGPHWYGALTPMVDHARGLTAFRGHVETALKPGFWVSALSSTKPRYTDAEVKRIVEAHQALAKRIAKMSDQQVYTTFRSTAS